MRFKLTSLGHHIDKSQNTIDVSIAILGSISDHSLLLALSSNLSFGQQYCCRDP